MHSFLPNLWLFAQAILKCALVTGIGPGILIVLFVEWRRRVKIQLESTSKIVALNGVPARIWEGHTETGIPVHCFVTRIAVEKTQDTSQFEAELQEHRAPSADVQVYPLRMVL
jgi:hypothetical protein